MEKLLILLQDLHPEVDFRTAQGLVELGVLDSFDIVSLVAGIEEELGVRIPVWELTAENFHSAQTIFALVERLR